MSTNIQVQRICLYCGNDFTAKTTTTKYCSHKCNSRHYKQKVKGDKIEASNSETKKVRTLKIDEVKAKEFLTIPELSILLGCSLRTAYRLVNNGTINSVNLAERMTRVKRSDIDVLLHKPQQNELSKAAQEPALNISDCYTLKEVQEKYKVSEGALQQLINRNKIPKMKIGRYAYVPKLCIKQLLT